MIENVLIIDCETSGLHPEHGAQIIELGAILYNVKHKAILQQFSTLIPCDANPVEHINNISVEITNCNYTFIWALEMTKLMSMNAQAVVAHNAQFDRKFILADHHLSLHFKDCKWICTKNDFQWPVPLKRTRLIDVCEAMGVQYVSAHRALVDCNFIVQCFGKVNDLQERIDGSIK